MKLRDKLWIWGQTPGLHHIWDQYGLPIETNNMTAFEGAKYFGIPNVCRVPIGGWPDVPYEQEQMVLDGMNKVCWGTSTQDETMFNAFKNIVATHPNITAAVLDDFFNDRYLATQTPDAVARLREKLHTEPVRPIELWAVLYCDELYENRKPFIKECDVITFWTIDGKLLPQLEHNFAKMKELTEDKPIYCGCYMWDYHGSRHLPIGLMKYQLDCLYKWLKAGEIEGIIFCSNCIGDIGLEAVAYTKQWIAEHGDEEM
ncbi:MAG: hypothetical protein IKC41_06940 [Clostridia bacterium]|nr:hypothetical protein [Clostridia bacterium]MBR2973924.1 hypothetical protein [Clostridia bacterium]